MQASSLFTFGSRQLARSRPQVMGIINLTPDSFSDGGELLVDGKIALDKVLYRAERMVADGASMLDIGGESTRPGAEPVTDDEELQRVAPVVEALAARCDAVLSVDTSSPVVMRAAAGFGAGLINDVRALARPGALAAAADSGLPVCLMHIKGEPRTMQEAPHYDDVVAEVVAYLRDKVAECRAAGIVAERLLLDPGFGFGKDLSHNLTLLRHLERCADLQLPLLIGLSRKRMLGAITGKAPKERMAAGLAAAVVAVMKGAWIIRTHDVAPTVDALKVCERLL